MSAKVSTANVQRISSSELARRPRQLMDEVLRENVIIVQNRGRDVAALVDIKEYERILLALNTRDTRESGP